MENIRLDQLIYEYCKKNQKYLAHYKLNYETTEERNSVIEFYSDKIDSDYVAAMVNDDEGFFVYDSSLSEIDVEISFPTKREIYGEYGENSPLYVYIGLYNKEGLLCWENTLE